MHIEDGPSTVDIWQVNWNATVKSTRAGQSIVKDISTVCGSKNNYSSVALETIHLGENLVKRLLSLIISACLLATCTLPANRIDFVKKNNAWCIFLGLTEEVANTRSTNTNEHLHKFRTRCANEGDARLPCDRTCHKSLACARWPLHDHAFGDLCANRSILGRILQKVHNFSQFLLCPIATSNITELNTSFRLQLDFRFRLAHIA
mmetsp:Transcript_123087/g.193193  ORF Transcript_123087/g.193193 Transcript_123087/m.193193 type:complete len:205 (+) Transcript_123087:859-1473(+)